MPGRAQKREDLEKLKIEFAPEVREGFRDLEAALHFGDHVGTEILTTLREWGDGKRPSIRDVVVDLPFIARETFEHIKAHNDGRANAAWLKISEALLENGFSVDDLRWTAENATHRRTHKTR